MLFACLLELCVSASCALGILKELQSARSNAIETDTTEEAKEQQTTTHTNTNGVDMPNSYTPPSIIGAPISSFTSGSNALDLLRRQASLKPIPTRCDEMDDIMGGGCPIGQITEFCQEEDTHTEHTEREREEGEIRSLFVFSSHHHHHLLTHLSVAFRSFLLHLIRRCTRCRKNSALVRSNTSSRGRGNFDASSIKHQRRDPIGAPHTRCCVMYARNMCVCM